MEEAMKRSRRSTLFAAALAALAAGSAACGSDDGSDDGDGDGAEPPVVLVHGAWMGAWAWDDVAASLRAGGRDVIAVELPAHGDDPAAVSDATLDAYADRVASALDEAGAPASLVGHSMAGMVITRVAEERPEQVAALVYLAAYLPRDGQSLFDLAQGDADSHAGPALVVDPEAGTGALPADQLADIFCADCPEAALDRLTSNYRDEPLAPLSTPVAVSAAGWGSVARDYIYTTEDNAVSFRLQQSMTDGLSFAGTVTLETSHSPFLSDPDVVVAALRDLGR
jgi:pimeloyl-ACP methyl ester carboxylesterase